MVVNDAARNLEEPGVHRRPPLEGRELPVDDDEDLLHRVLHGGPAHPEAADRLPDVVDVLVVDLLERHRGYGLEGGHFGPREPRWPRHRYHPRKIAAGRT